MVHNISRAWRKVVGDKIFVEIMFSTMRIGGFAKGGNVKSLQFRVLISKENDISKSPNFRAYDEGVWRRALVE
jgi:hypothetical protein